ncbi:response regulator transcription factor [Collimonas pratensis]|uniref:Bacterial regulatory s, luxR family protein n=1 Tax=Collimonas pratensis TaxID=279113 RepID=A0A127QAA3_9BURK|nr:response regulator transcription factor [Collimonas pratensis]AMP06968.1 bacterial regulatory s, luxR family protein [Collimonas pratensis]
MIRVLIADDHAIVREGLKQLFALGTEVAAVGEAVNGGQVLDALHAGGIDLVLLDMTMPGVSGVNLIQRIRAHESYPPVLVLSMHNELPIARRALAAGASGYLTKDNKPETLMLAIRKVVAGGRFIDPELAEQMVFESGSSDQRPPHELLSDREFHILQLLVRGKSVNQVAEELSISNKTVSTHKARLMQKMNFQNNAELVRYAITYNLIE